MSVGRPPLAEILPQAFPWIRFLPDHDRVTFAREFVELTETGDATALLQLITAWRHTAEIHADPELLATLSSETVDDFGVVTAPAL
jgi:hypothetical protein